MTHRDTPIPPVARTALAVLLIVAAPLAAANEWYRYTNDDGVVVLSHSIPPDAVHRGYEVLDRSGRRIRVVDPAPTPEEIAAREAAQAAAQAAEEQRQARQRRDEELLVLYASPDEVLSARDRRLKAIDNQLRMAQAEIERLQGQKRQFEAQAAERERTGQRPSQSLLDSLRHVEGRIRDSDAQLANRERERRDLEAQFEADYQRTRDTFAIQIFARTVGNEVHDPQDKPRQRDGFDGSCLHQRVR
jgi:hypothetical protein